MQLDRSVWGSPGGALDTFLKNGAEFKVDIDALEARFARPDAGRRAPTADGADGPPGLISSRSRRVALLDPKRSTKLGIVMKKIEAALGAKEVAEAIITESVLSFLGLGFPPDFPTWGRLLFDGLQYMQVYPERVVWPGLAISLTVLSVNYIGDGLRDALDPRIRGR